MKKVTLTNSYHNTKTVVLVPASVADGWHGINEAAWLQAERPAVWRRVRKALCGVKGCMCGVAR